MGRADVVAVVVEEDVVEGHCAPFMRIGTELVLIEINSPWTHVLVLVVVSQKCPLPEWRLAPL
jgi:hypothetical protein